MVDGARLKIGGKTTAHTTGHRLMTKQRTRKNGEVTTRAR